MSNWRPYSDPPEKTGDYLCVDPNAFPIHRYVVGRYDTYNKQWYDGSDGIHPTYWMMIPLDPSEEAEILKRQQDNPCKCTEINRTYFGEEGKRYCYSCNGWRHI